MPSTENKRMLFYFHCGKCTEELPPGQSAKSFSRLEIGAIDEGLQVWCIRHDIKVCDIDFCGSKIKFT